MNKNEKKSNNNLEVQKNFPLETNQSTNVGVNFLRYIAIFILIYSHLASCIPPQFMIWLTAPIFFMITGFFCIKRDKPRFKYAVFNFLSYIIFGFIAYLIVYYADKDNISGIQIPFSIFWQVEGYIDYLSNWWFLIGYLFVILLSPLINKMIKKIKWISLTHIITGIIYFGTIFFLIQNGVIPNNLWSLIWHFIRGILYYSFAAWVSYWLKNFYSLKRNENKKNAIFITIVTLSIILYAGTIITCWFFRDNNVVYNFNRYIEMTPLMYICGMSLILIFYQWKSKNKYLIWLSGVGRKSLGMYLFHGWIYSVLILIDQTYFASLNSSTLIPAVLITFVITTWFGITISFPLDWFSTTMIKWWNKLVHKDEKITGRLKTNNIYH